MRRFICLSVTIHLITGVDVPCGPEMGRPIFGGQKGLAPLQFKKVDQEDMTQFYRNLLSGFKLAGSGGPEEAWQQV